MQRVALLNIVGLNADMLQHAPRLRRRGRAVRLRPVLPAVTCSVQASMLTGAPPREHGIVGNGWYHRHLAEVRFWHRSSRLFDAEPIWEAARRRDGSFTCVNLFWWHNAYATCEVVANVRPIYKADGRKLPDCYTEPFALRDELQGELGTFPLFRFWGPGADITSSRWIAHAAQRIEQRYAPTLTLVYLPHLDYALQKLGPQHADIPRHVAEIDDVAGDLLDHLDARDVRSIIVSEYGIEPVEGAITINRVLRESGWLALREEDGLEMLEPGASGAFAVADHQVAHVYVRDAARVGDVATLCRDVPGVEQVLDRDAQRDVGLDHARAGDLVLVARRGRWFAYDWWLDDARAPDFARTVDIHRKPGYDPRELFIDPAIRWPGVAIGWRVAKKKLGLRTLMDVIPLDASLVRGSHGRVEQPPSEQPVMLGADGLVEDDELPCTAVRDVVWRAVFRDV